MLNDTLAGLGRIFCAVTLLAALGALTGCSGNDVGPEPPWNLTADQGSGDASQGRTPENH